jgi:hypothetical protein
MPTVQANADGSYTITVPAPAAPVAVPAVTEAEVQTAVDTAVADTFNATPPVVA